MNKRIPLLFFMVMPAFSALASDTGLIPGNTHGMYYQLGGGDVTPLP